MIQLIGRIKAFHFAFLKMKFIIQDLKSLILSIKSYFQPLLGRGNESRRVRNQEIQGLRCLNSLITQNIQEYIFLSKRESTNRVEIRSGHSIISSSLINGLDEMPEYKSSSLSRVHPIRNGAFRLSRIIT